MALRCFVFSPDQGTSDLIGQVLTGLDVEGESCPEAATAGEKIAKELFQLVVIDWEQQPDATTLLSTARERKAAARPLVLAIVSDDASVPKALQAGANSILRRPLLVNQVTDTLSTARDLLRARGPAVAAAAAAAAASASASSAGSENAEAAKENAIGAGELCAAASSCSSGQWETEQNVASAQEQSLPEPVSSPPDPEALASSVPATPPPPPPEEPRTLEELLRARGAGRQTGSPASSSGSARETPELLGFAQSASHASTSSAGAAPARAREPRKEPELFSSFRGEPAECKEASPSRFRPGKGMIVWAAILAGCAVVAAPQAPWHRNLQGFWWRGQRGLHTWLNPQPVTTPIAPAAHEDFGRPGDEYKLPVPETIPDATTDPQQIRVVPVVDPTAKKPNNGTANTDQPAPLDTPPASPADGAQPSATTVPDSQSPQPAPAATQPASAPAAPPSTPAATVTTAPDPQNSASPAVTYSPVTPVVAQPTRQPAPYVPPPAPKVPSSLQSGMATMVPDASGNKPPEAAMSAIEPVTVSELTERALLSSQPPLDFPAAMGGQRGTVILQVLVGRDGSVEDAKLLEGSLAFARAAIAAVKQWKFKPYVMNGRPVSIETTLTLKFPPQ